jgi:TRAP-type C4-dicarboxylate transport system substrate-binding protein
MFGMNKERYESLPADLKAILDANSGAKVAQEFGSAWEGFEAGGIAALDKAGVETIVLSDEEAAKFNKASEGVVQRWVEEANSKGIDGEALVKQAREAIAAAAAARK